jgi:hypothetical protein
MLRTYRYSLHTLWIIFCLKLLVLRTYVRRLDYSESQQGLGRSHRDTKLALCLYGRSLPIDGVAHEIGWHSRKVW